MRQSDAACHYINPGLYESVNDRRLFIISLRKFHRQITLFGFYCANQLTNNTKTAGFHLKRNISFCLYVRWCMFVCVDVCRCLLMYVCVCWCLSASVDVCLRVLVFVGECWCMFVCVGACWCLLARVDASVADYIFSLLKYYTLATVCFPAFLLVHLLMRNCQS